MIPTEKRFKGEAVQRAYRAIGLRPSDGYWFEYAEDPDGPSDVETAPVACRGAAALYIAAVIEKGESMTEAVDQLHDSPVRCLEDQFGVPSRYVEGFAAGFDRISGPEVPQGEEEAEDFNLGYQDGIAAAKLIFGNRETP